LSQIRTCPAMRFEVERVIKIKKMIVVFIISKYFD
jgi:hypothetical protein